MKIPVLLAVVATVAFSACQHPEPAPQAPATKKQATTKAGNAAHAKGKKAAAEAPAPTDDGKPKTSTHLPMTAPAPTSQ